MARLCPKASSCGGCSLNGVKYSRQLEMKQAYVENLIGTFGPVAPIMGMENPFYYRNKVQSVFGYDRKGELVSGIYREGTHRLVPVRECMIEDVEADSILSTLRMIIKRLGIPPYDEDLQKGVIRHVLIRRAVKTGESLVVLVIGSHDIKHKGEIVRQLVEKHPSVRTILVNVNGEKTSMVLSERPCTVIYGDGYIEDELCGLRFRISAKSFYQVNHDQAEVLYTVAMKMARFKGSEKIIDAYCGTGTIGLIAASWCKGSVLGIELNPDAVADARENARINGILNASFIAADASGEMKQMARSGEKVDVVFMDPPRSGSDERFLSSVIKLSPRTIIYISCNPETLARDLRYLLRMGPYRMIGAQPVDLFPQTDHIETIVLLQKLNS